MYKKILVPLDGSKTAEAVLPLARSWSSKAPGGIDRRGRYGGVGA